MRHHDPYIRDLLLDPRDRRSSRAKYLLILGLLGVAFGGFFYIRPPQAGPPSQLEQEDSLQLASAVVHRSVFAARIPLHVPSAPLPLEDQIALEAPSDNIAPTLKLWEEGTPTSLSAHLMKNQSVLSALKQRNLDSAKLQPVIMATSELFDFRHSQPGDQWFIDVDAQGLPVKFRYQTSPEDVWETTRTQDGKYACEKIEVPLDRRTVEVAGVIDDGLWRSLEQAGLEAHVVAQFIDVFAYSIDLTSRTRPGDRFALVFERVYLDGKLLRPGDILAATYEQREDTITHQAYYYEAPDGENGYYDENGKSLQRQFLRSPLNRPRITSRFGRRFHPVLKRWKRHNGVDYGAPTGTPVRAMADGVVTHAGWKGAMGKTVAIKHPNGYHTYYAHLSGIAPKIKRGVRVTRRSFVGRVGSTGRSTGPHLHYGLKHKNRWVDPLKVEFKRDKPLKGKALETFLTTIVSPRGAQLRAQLSKTAMRILRDFDVVTL